VVIYRIVGSDWAGVAANPRAGERATGFAGIMFGLARSWRAPGGSFPVMEAAMKRDRRDRAGAPQRCPPHELAGATPTYLY
jgi:hypothetical protein